MGTYLPDEWQLACAEGYLVTHALPLAHAFRLRYGTSLKVHVRGGTGQLWPPELLSVLPPLRYSHGRVLCLDVPSLVIQLLLARRCVYLDHALIGKGLVHRKGRPHPALRMAKMILFPEEEQIEQLTPRWRARCHACGHLPEDWLDMPLSYLPEPARDRLAMWRSARGPRVLLLGTRGALSGTEWWPALFRDLGARYTLGVKPHPAAEQSPLPDTVLDLRDLPVPLLAQHADLVVGDHSSATMECVRQGRPVLMLDTPSLRRLEATLPPGSPEFAYMRTVRRLTSIDQLQSELRRPQHWPAETGGCQRTGQAGARIVELLAHIP